MSSIYDARVNKRILITGAVTPKIDMKALAWLTESVTELRPDEIVCFEGSPELLNALRKVYDGPIGVHIGETTDRVTQLPEFYEIAPGWISTHGHRGGISLSRIAGNTALNAAKRFNKSVVMGHTHRLGMGSYTTGRSPDSKTVTGIEAGSLAVLRAARQKNAQRGFCTITVKAQHVRPEVVPFAPAWTK